MLLLKIQKNTKFKLVVIEKCDIWKKLWYGLHKLRWEEKRDKEIKKKTLEAYWSFNYDIISIIEKISIKQTNDTMKSHNKVDKTKNHSNKQK
jgi:hypothetical protein